jgi:AraC-like DNA-binding protein
MPADNSRHLRAAARRRSNDTRQRAVKALRRLDATGAPITFDTVAREAAVSRSWLYAQTDMRHEIERRRARPRTASPATVVPERQRATDASLLRRLQAATERIKRLEQNNRELREALAQALGEHRMVNILGTTDSRDTPEKQPAKHIDPC